MKYEIAALCLFASCLVWYKTYSRGGRDVTERIRWKLDKTVGKSGDSRNCTFTSCYESGRCVLNTSHVTVFIQPLLEVIDENDRLLSPVPSLEFLEIRKSLLPFAVDDPQYACLTFPGVDFLNFDRFEREEDVVRVVAALKMKLPNVFVVNFLGKAPLLDVMLVSAFPSWSVFRHQFDVSIPLILPPGGDREELFVEKSEILLAPLSNIPSGQKQDVSRELQKMGKNVTIVSECPENPSEVCDHQGNSVDLEKLIQSHRFVLLLDSSPLFPRLLSTSLRAGTIPVLISDQLVLPFTSFIDWFEYGLLPSSVSRIQPILAKMTMKEVEKRSEKCRLLYERTLSSPSAVIENVIYELETRLLPFSSRFQDDKCVPLLPHISPAPVVCAFVIASDSSVIHRVNTLCRSTIVSKIAVIWTPSKYPPNPEEWICKKTAVDVIFSAEHESTVTAAQANPNCQAILFVPEFGCSPKERKIHEATAIWQSNPRSLIHLPPEVNGCLPAVILHNIYLSHCLREGQVQLLNSEGRVSSLPSIWMEEQELVSLGG